MSEQDLPSIKEYLSNAENQQRIRQDIWRGRMEATVTTSLAARLFGFSENQLRDWEARGLLHPSRSMRQGKPGHRRYASSELDKLAIISDLLKQGYSISDISPDIGAIWHAQAPELTEHPDQDFLRESEAISPYEEHFASLEAEPGIDERAESAYQRYFWRYFVAQVLRMVLLILSEDAAPNKNMGLVLPLHSRPISPGEITTQMLSAVGESLIGWLGRSRTSYTFLSKAPSLASPNYYEVLALREMRENIPEGPPPKDRTLIIIDRRDIRLTLNTDIVESIRSLLATVYESQQEWYAAFGKGFRDWIQPVADFTSSSSRIDPILPELANMIVRSGGRTADGRDRWRFCCIMIPTNTHLPLHQRSLVVRAQSRHSPHKVGITTVSPGNPFLSLSIRAFQSGKRVYLPRVSEKNATIESRELEEPLGSALALPVGAEQGQPVAVLYIVSDEQDAFSLQQQRLLRIVGRIVEELLLTYWARMQVTEHLGHLISHPGIGDRFFAEFASEDDFRHTLEEALEEISITPETEGMQPDGYENTHALSLIAIDIDQKDKLAIQHGDNLMRNLYRAIGQRALAQLTAFTGADYKLYHILGGCFYLLLKDTSLKQAQDLAKKLSQALQGPYLVDPLCLYPEQPTLSVTTLTVKDVSVHMGIVSYLHKKLATLLPQQLSEKRTAVVEIGAEIVHALNLALSLGTFTNGSIMSWDRKENKFQSICAFHDERPG